MIKKINHIAIIVPDLDTSLTFWRDTLGLPLTHVEEVASQESIVAFLPTGDSEVELVKPTTEASGAARFLAKRGPGLHHIALEVDNLEEMLGRLKEKGVRLINETPITAAGGNRAAFIHPESANGVLVELYEVRET
ncbi:MAG: methylmalonyl-CoA epimerase [Chloroflexi bacterium]|nr:methylmalonyl-CoA epimerase [Chloroflexota bacterium]